MQRRTKLAALGAVALATIGTTAATAGGDSDQPLTGTDHDAAVEAALAHTGGGEVTETEVGDDGAAYGVEVRLPDGREVEVNLDANFAVIGSENDDDGSGDNDGAGDD
jgi:uncharacterized membrane protein YkoI